VDRGDCQKRVKAGGHALLAHHPAPLLRLEPRQGPRGVEPPDHLLARSAPGLLRLPAPLRELRPAAPFPALRPQRFGILACSGRHDLEALARTAAVARADLDRLKAWEPLRPLVSVGRGRPVRQGHARPRGETVAQHAFALPPAGDARAPTLARGQTRQRRRQTPHDSSRCPRLPPACALAAPPACQPSASAAPSAAWHSSTPMAAPEGPHTTGSRSSTHPATYARFAETAPGASHGHASAGQGERHPRTSATLERSHLHICLPLLPSSIELGQ